MNVVTHVHAGEVQETTQAVAESRYSRGDHSQPGVESRYENQQTNGVIMMVTLQSCGCRYINSLHTKRWYIYQPLWMVEYMTIDAIS